MLPEKDLDTVLQEAQDAVNDLATATGAEPATAAPPKAGAAPNATPATPAPPFAPIRPAFAGASHNPRLQRVLKLRVPVIVRLAQRRMRIADVMQLTPGSILEFERPVDSELDLLVNNKCIGSGEAVKIGEKFGLRIRYVGDLRTRIASLGRARP